MIVIDWASSCDYYSKSAEASLTKKPFSSDLICGLEVFVYFVAEFYLKTHGLI